MNGRVQSVCKAMDLLACLAQAKGPLTLSELSARTGIPKATAHGLLSSMRPSAVIEQSDADGRYRLGMRLFEYGCIVSRGWNVLEAAAEPLRHVAEETGETASISALDRGEVLVLDCADAHSDLRVVSEKGARLPVHCTSQGKLLLAYLPAARRKSILRECDFTTYTPTATPTLNRWRRNWRTSGGGAMLWRTASTASACAVHPRRFSEPMDRPLTR